jgi:hypothetical protein
MAVSFFELGIALDAILFIITVSIASMSYRMYALFRKPSYRQFSIAFLFISIGYFFSTILNILHYPILEEFSMHLQPFIALIMQLWFVPVLLGLLLLTYLYYDLREWELRLLLAVLIGAAFYLGRADRFAFFIISGILFLFIALKLYRHYRASPDKSGRFVLAGFSLLFIAKLFSGVLFLHGGLYVGYYLFKLAGVVLIARSLWVISR